MPSFSSCSVGYAATRRYFLNPAGEALETQLHLEPPPPPTTTTTTTHQFFLSLDIVFFSCSKCGRLLTNDRLLNLLLPPVLRPHQQQLTKVPKDQKSEQAPAYHVGCYTDEV